MIIVDIDVWNRKIRAYKPDIQTPLPNDDIHKVIFWNNVDPTRINKRTHGYLKAEASKRARKNRRRIWSYKQKPANMAV